MGCVRWVMESVQDHLKNGMLRAALIRTVWILYVNFLDAKGTSTVLEYSR